MTAFLLPHLVEAAATAHAAADAVADVSGTIDYESLDGRANQIARLLRDIGVAPHDRVGLLMQKSIDAVAAIYGVMKAGAAYVPLDAGAPAARLAYVIDDCELRCVVMDAAHEQVLRDLGDATHALRLAIMVDGDATVETPGHVSTFPATAIAEQDATSVRSPTLSVDLAYILYTSGSTGTPKGVMLSHRNALTFVNWAVRRFGVTHEDRLSSHAPFHFDLSIFDLFAAAAAGATIALVPPSASVFPLETRRFISESRISIWYSVPSILTMLLLRGGVERGDFPRLRTILYAGETFPTQHLRGLMERLQGVRFFNLFGPTETNVCTCYEVPPNPQDADPIPIGRPIDDVEIRVLNPDGADTERGEVGELHVRGAAVMQGYWRQPEATERAFLRVGDMSPPQLLYRTGDLVREREDGELVFLGRRDAQVKSRGYRIELGDVEGGIMRHSGVVECCVVAAADANGTTRLHAFVVARESLDETELLTFCRTQLPAYMLPESFVFRDSLPRTSTGKIDRQSLAERAAR